MAPSSLLKSRKERVFPPSLLPCAPCLVLTEFGKGLEGCPKSQGKVIYSNFIFQQIQDRRWVEAAGGSPGRVPSRFPKTVPLRRGICSLGERTAAA